MLFGLDGTDPGLGTNVHMYMLRNCVALLSVMVKKIVRCGGKKKKKKGEKKKEKKRRRRRSPPPVAHRPTRHAAPNQGVQKEHEGVKREIKRSEQYEGEVGRDAVKMPERNQPRYVH